MTTAAKSLSGCLPYLGVLRFTGPDAQSFLQGQVSNDTRRLEQAQSIIAAYSNPQGRVLALLRLLPHSSGIIAVLPRELVSPTLQILRRFVLRSKVTIEDASERLSVAGQQDGQQLQRARFDLSQSGYVEQRGIGISPVSAASQRYWTIGAAQMLAEHGLTNDRLAADLTEREWRLADIRDGLPQIYLATRELFVAQMLNLDLVDGISFSKGCYTGQEIIARTQHLGRIKRRMYRLELPDGAWHIGQPLLFSDGRSGRLIEVSGSDDGFEALAVLNVEPNPVAAGESDSHEALPAALMPLPYSMS